MPFSIPALRSRRFSGLLFGGLTAVSLVAVSLAATPAHAQQTLFDDEFNGSTFDPTGQWNAYDSTHILGRTQFGLAPSIVTDGGVSFARLPLKTYNSAYNSKTPLTNGAEIFSRNTFKVGTGIEIEARLRGYNMPRGVTYGLYAYNEKGVWPNGYLKEEADFELVSDLASNQFWSNIWNDWNVRYGYDDGIHNSDGIVTVPGLDTTAWTTYTARWYPNRFEWYVNGQLARTSTTIVPDDPLGVHFNIWAPDTDWGAAYDSFLQATADSTKNYTCGVDVDYVHVKRLPAPTAGSWGTGDGLLAQYFPQPNFAGTPVTRVDPRLYNDWKGFSPDVNIPNDNFSARWTGFIQSPYSENVTLTLRADDGVRLYLNNNLIIDDWRNTTAADRTAVVAMTAGVKVPLRVEYYDATGPASAQLFWQSASMPKTVVPQSQLYSGDTVIPTVAITAPAANLTATSVDTITGTAADTRKDGSITSAGTLDHVGVTLKRTADSKYFDGYVWQSGAVEATATGTTTWHLPLTGMTEGGYSISAVAIDTAGNRSKATARSFWIDTAPPTVAITSPTNNSSGTAPTTVKGTAFDAGRGLGKVFVLLQRASDNRYWNGTAWVGGGKYIQATGSTSWSFPLPTLANDSYILLAQATDLANKVGNATPVTFTVGTSAADKTAPTLKIVTPVKGYSYLAIGASGTAIDAGSGVASVQATLQRATDKLFLNGSTWSTTAGTFSATLNGSAWSLSLPQQADGSYTIAVKATDKAGNVSPAASVQFWVDTVGPTTTITTPADSATYAALSSATGTVTDIGTGTSRVALALMRSADGFWWTGSTWSASYTEINPTFTAGGTSWSYALPSLAGTYVLNAQGYDYAGNAGNWVKSTFTVSAAKTAAVSPSAPAS